MGIFKDMKRMKETVAGAPALIHQAQDLQAAAAQQQAAAAAQRAATAAAVPPAPAAAPVPLSEADLAPIAGVSLQDYAEVGRQLAAVGNDVTLAPQLAASRGVEAGDWAAAVEGWNQRMLAEPAIARELHRLYLGG
jgi:hypothetical protein